MRRVIVPALLAIALVATSTTTANAGLFDKLCGNSCDSCCDVEPACGCEAACEPACGCEVACEPACGCETDCCDSGCGSKGGFLKRLFGKHNVAATAAASQLADTKLQLAASQLAVASQLANQLAVAKPIAATAVAVAKAVC